MFRSLVYLTLLSSLSFITSQHLSLNYVLFQGDFEFVDLTHSFDTDTVYWPKTRLFNFIKKNESFLDDGSWYAANEFEAGEHGGTHIDAPFHFYVNGKRVGDIPLEKLIVALIIVDLSSLVNDDPNFVLYKHHLDYLLNDNFWKPCVLVFKFGWSKFIKDKNKYIGLTHDNKLNFPGLSEEIAQWITTSYKNVVGIGVDTCSIDPGSSTNFTAHKIFSKAGLYNMENVKLDVKIPEYGCTALVMPMKIKLGSGAPLRLTAICPKVKIR